MMLSIIKTGLFRIKDRINRRWSLFAKWNGLLLLLFIPIMATYSYSNDVAFNVVSKELQLSNAKQLAFLSSQIDSRITGMMDFAISFSKDPNVQKFNGLTIWDERYDRMQTRYIVQEKMALQSGMMNIWPVKYAVYSQQNREVITSANDLVAYEEAYLKRNVREGWNYSNSIMSGGQGKAFHWFYTDSLVRQGELSGSNLVVEASFSPDNIRNMLDSYKSGGKGDPLFYRKGEQPILNSSADEKVTAELVDYLNKQSLAETTQQVVKLGKKDFVVSSIVSPHLGWHLVDVIPLEEVLEPISFSRNLFYLTMVLLFAVGISFSILLYRNVQRPIRRLIGGLQRVQRGDYSVRIDSNGHNEFSYLFYRFNDMSRQIQDLIENVLSEKLRAREATLKQLQAQINPHFLYNCLGFIINMAQMKDEQAVVSMAYNLSAYYRYTTRMERETATLQEEIKLIVNYLDIQKLRIGRIHYEIQLPEEMLAQQVPRLLLQPVVENAVIHGVGRSYTSGEIRIAGEIADGYCKVYIDDDGPGMSPEQLEALNQKMLEPLQEEMGCGLWNTNQRLYHLFGGKSAMRFTRSPLGGFRTEMTWRMGVFDESLRENKRE
ncbi:sensor histidine kinase [Paenibacillus sp. GCM10027626]|uniref:sensor histidine kinase n=1 Tax=Paenibacillus sp. GCM10027626 TaxID=3273411 RepID=UPI00363486FF